VKILYSEEEIPIYVMNSIDVVKTLSSDAEIQNIAMIG
jgi:hypothetical protein